jgi:hypothetical protein
MMLSETDRHALRLLAVCLDDDYPGLLIAGDYGDDAFDSGLLVTADDRTYLSQSGADVVGLAEAEGLADRCPAFALMLLSYDDLPEDNVAAIDQAVAAGQLIVTDGRIDLTVQGLNEISAELALVC